MAVESGPRRNTARAHLRGIVLYQPNLGEQHFDRPSTAKFTYFEVPSSAGAGRTTLIESENVLQLSSHTWATIPAARADPSPSQN